LTSGTTESILRKDIRAGTRTKGVIDHLRKELDEVEKEPTDLLEWIDLVLLALDGAWRHGYTPGGNRKRASIQTG